MFIVFALNLFDLYQLSLPQGLLQRLDQIQQRQKAEHCWVLASWEQFQP